METKIKVSVVIPCLNMGDYLPGCLSSVMNQSLKEIEIICIDDGSDDDTSLILDKYRRQNSNIECAVTENRGAGYARNLGISMALGEYVAFIDADDFYPAQDILEYLYNVAKAQKADVCGGSACYYKDGVYIDKGLRNGITFTDDCWINKERFPNYSGFWRFLYKRKFINDNTITFPDYLRCQDPPFLLKAVSEAKQVFCVKKIVYCYRKEHKQVEYNERKALDYAKGIKDSLQIAQENNMIVVYDILVKEIHGEFSALVYQKAVDSSEMRHIIYDINQILLRQNISKKFTLLEGEELSDYLDNVREERKALLYRLKAANKVLIFGAGTIGRIAMHFFKQYGVRQEAFAVTDTEQNEAEIEGISVKSIDDYVEVRDNCFVLIATFARLHREIIALLEDRGFKNYIAADVEKLCLFDILK